MIKVEIVSATNSLRLGTSTFYKDYILVGSDLLCELYFPEDNIPKNFIAIEIRDNNLYCSFKDDVIQYIHVNGKVTKGKKRIYANDTVGYNGILIKVLEFKLEVTEDKKSYLNRRLEELQDQHSPLLEIISDLSNKV